ncbi:N-6 DNA methylase [Enterobacter sp. PTB]|uniref:N-6 DNA methylase n=1 Tax=Enterobacter sp. PTB TaxID=3143437 RepID=UPI003DA9639B
MTSLTPTLTAAGHHDYDHYRRTFTRLFSDTARYHHRHEVFRDFTALGALAVQNAFLRCPALEKEYLATAGRYQPEDMRRMAQLLGCLVCALDSRPGDFLGEIFMDLEIGSAHMGQFFTPFSLSQLMARVTVQDVVQQLELQPFITLDESAAGAGSMVIAFAQALTEQGINPQQTLFARCTDIDATAAQMCYLQLSYLGIPAEVITGNSLTLDARRVFRTPFWYLGGWEQRLHRHPF